MTHDSTYTPIVTVKVDPNGGNVIAVEVDWSDSLQNTFQSDGAQIWDSSDGAVEPWTAVRASDYLDDETLQNRVLAALQPYLAAPPDPS